VVTNTKVNGPIASAMAVVQIFFQMETYTLASISKEDLRDWDSTNGKMEIHIRESLGMG